MQIREGQQLPPYTYALFRTHTITQSLGTDSLQLFQN